MSMPNTGKLKATTQVSLASEYHSAWHSLDRIVISQITHGYFGRRDGIVDLVQRFYYVRVGYEAWQIGIMGVHKMYRTVIIA